MTPPAGLAAIRKAAGLTSFKALAPLKRRAGTTRIGHTGTLDLFASGLLLVLVGPYSRLAPWFSSLDKLYRARILFGEETDTLDPEGEVVARAAPPSLEALEAVLPAFRGPILQRPPAYSAVHVDGKRAYERALGGEEPEMKPRPVIIHELKLEAYDGSTADFSVRCSSGTYIRSLARDIALAAGSRARLSALERSRVGPFLLEEAVAAEDFEPSLHLRRLDPETALALGLRPRRLVASATRSFLNGGRLNPAWLSDIPRSAPAPSASAQASAQASAETATQAAAQAEASSAVFAEDGSLLGVVDEPRGQGRGEIAYRFVLGGAS